MVSRKVFKETVTQELLQLLPEDAIHKPVKELSGGQKRRVAIVRACAIPSDILIMDEPFVGLDPKAAFILKEIMKEMTEKGSAIFFSTHVLEVAEKLCNKVSIIKSGKLITSGLMSEVVKSGESLEELFMENV